jgi:Tfp pilus assembly protein PilN
VLFFATTVVAAVPVLAWRRLPARRRLIAMLGIALLVQIISVLLELVQPPLIK